MKTRPVLAVVGVLTFVALVAFWPSRTTSAAESTSPSRFEYATLRWAGRDNTHLIRPDGSTEMLGNQLKPARKPDRVDDRSFYMNLAMNALAKEGYELASMTSDDYIMKRLATK